MWTLVFDNNTKRGVALNREPKQSEFAVSREPRDCGWFALNPSRYQYVNLEFSDYPGWEQEEADKEAAKAAALAELEARKAAIESAKDSANLKQYTVEQAEAWITQTLTDAPATVVGVKQAVGQILIRMLPYIIPKE